jgi:hypothetical protein
VSLLLASSDLVLSRERPVGRDEARRGEKDTRRSPKVTPHSGPQRTDRLDGTSPEVLVHIRRHQPGDGPAPQREPVDIAGAASAEISRETHGRYSVREHLPCPRMRCAGRGRPDGDPLALTAATI